MFDRFHAIRWKCMDFTIHGSRVNYMVCCIWISMQVHMVMDEFMANGMKYNSTISAALMRFLTMPRPGWPALLLLWTPRSRTWMLSSRR